MKLMKLTVDRELLVERLGVCRRAISNKSTLPILANVLLKADKKSKRLYLTSTDLDLSIMSSVAAEIEDGGSISVSGSMLHEIVKSLPGEKAHIALAERGLTVADKSVMYEVLTLPADEFPGVDVCKPSITFDLELQGVLSRTLYAAAKKEANPILTGALFQVNGNVGVCCTDTHRLAWEQVKPEAEQKEKIDVIIPVRALKEVKRLEGAVNVKLSGNQASFANEEVTIVTRVIDGQFPGFSKVIPQKPERSFTCNREALLGAIKRALIIAKHNADKVVLHCQRKRAVIKAESMEDGRVIEACPGQLEGKPLTVGMNGYYLHDTLASLSDEMVVLQMEEDGKVPVKIESGALVAVIMPMAL